MSAHPSEETGPSHVGVIMDGNRRWAKARLLPSLAGHREGLKSAKTIVTAARKHGVRFLTLYAFSTENWRRSQDEVAFLMGLIREFLRRELEFYHTNRIRILHTGDCSSLPCEVVKELDWIQAETAQFDDLTVNLAVNHGGRDEIARAMRTALADGHDATDVSVELIRSYLDQPEVPDIDLVIRTGGEHRLSNFMLWRASYAELYFTDTLWPDFDADEFGEIVSWFIHRDRRFGGDTRPDKIPATVER